MTTTLDRPLPAPPDQRCAAPDCGLYAERDGLCGRHWLPSAPGRAEGILGREEPRLWTRPLRPLTRANTHGWEAITFAESVLGFTLLPWQKWWLLHALELKYDGTYRFRTILTLVGRQQGKTTLLKIVALWAMYLNRVHLVLGAAQSLDIARESWKGALDIARANPRLEGELTRVTTGSIETAMTLTNGARYRITAATPGSGRGLSVDLLILDELREQRDWEAWGALSKTTIARPNGLIIAISNAGDEKSVVLNSLRATAMAQADESIALFEYSAPDGCALDDTDAWCQSMPGLGHGTITEAAVRLALATDPENVFRTELLCQSVDALNSALDLHGWAACADQGLDLAPIAERTVMCLDVSPDGGHVTLVTAAGRDDGKVAFTETKSWGSTEDARADLPGILRAARPRALGWYPSGPAAVLGAELGELNADKRGPIGRMTVDRKSFREWAPGLVELRGDEVKEACQTLADLVMNRKVVHNSTALLNSHATGAQRLDQGDGWRFVRRGAGHVDGMYAAAGAVHLVRSLPTFAPPPKSAVW
jgi:hypothetical protein